MTNTSTFCLAQEALQRNRATVANLENVRMIATSAAAAWAREAASALRREAKLGHEAQLPTAASVSEEEEDSWFSENPDRYLAG